MLSLIGFIVLLLFTTMAIQIVLLVANMLLGRYNIGGVANPLFERFGILIWWIVMIVWWHFLFSEIAPFSITFQN